MDFSDGANQDFRSFFFVNQTGGAGSNGTMDLLVGRCAGQQDRASSASGKELIQEIDRRLPAKLDIHEKKIGTFAFRDIERALPVQRLPNNLNIRLRREEHFETRTDDCVIFDNADPNGRGGHNLNGAASSDIAYDQVNNFCGAIKAAIA